MKQSRSYGRAAGITGALALVTGGLLVPFGAAVASPNSHHAGGVVPPEDGTYHHSHSKVRHYSTKHPAAPQAGAVGTTAGKTLSWQGGSNVNGQAAQGVVSSTPKVYLVYWGSQWGTQGANAAGNLTMSKDYAGGAPVAEALFKGLGTGGEKWSGVLTQYCDGASLALGATACPANAPHVGYPTGGALAGVWYDNSAAEPVPASGTQIGNEALAAAAHFGNNTAASNRYAQYIVLSAPGTNPSSYLSGNAGCAWHSDAWSGALNTSVAFTNQPYNMDTNFCGKNFLTAGSGGTLDGYTMTLGHEYAETVSDQYPSSGWVATNGSENGDDCAWSGSSAYVQMSTGSFAMQPTWSNDTNACEMAHVIVGAPVPGPTTVTVTNPGNQTGTVGTAVNLQIKATDTSATEKLTYAATGLPAGLAINASTGVITGTPSAAATATVSVKATDGTGVSNAVSFTWTVNATSTCATTQLLANPGFESGSSPWTATGGVIQGDGYYANTGKGYAWLDGYNTAHTDSVAQTVTIPAGCKAYLNYHLKIWTAQTASTAIDTMTVTVNGTRVQQWSNRDTTGRYLYTGIDLSKYAGQTVTVKWTGVQAGATPTSFYLDDTTLYATQ